MKHRLPTLLAVMVCLASPSICFGQTLASAPLLPVVGQPAAPGTDTPRVPAPFRAPASDSFWAPFASVPDDFVRFLSKDTMKLVGAVGAGALLASRWDGQSVQETREHLGPASRFTAGNIGGGFLVQTGAAFGVYAVSRLAHNDKLSAVGGDLVRAQILSQGIVQAGKLLTNRPRPDGSNNHSLPSGHTASAFATASVLQRHFGWKVGVPAYGFGAYVAASRMRANKHNLSDVLMGAAIGIAAGKTVTVGTGRAQFEMGVAPALGGAAISFTRRAR